MPKCRSFAPSCCPSAKGVQAIHDRGILHRDLKPSNIFLRAVGDAVVPTVIDLGVARQVGGEELTVASLAPGSPSYMAPERYSKSGALDHRADQFALGVVAYQLLTGAGFTSTPSPT